MTTSYYLVGIGTGHVLAKNMKDKSGHVVLENKGENDDEQKWTVEFGDEPDLVALKCVADGKYMISPEIGVRDNAGVILGDDKQWWKVSNDNLTPNVACRFNLASRPEQFIYTHGAVLEKGQHHTAHMRDWKASDSMQNWQKDFGFYFVDTSTGFEPAAPMPATSATPKEKLVASNTKPQSTASPRTVYLYIAHRHYVLTYQKSRMPSGAVVDHKGRRKDEQEQQWTVEYGDEPDVIALRNVASGTYMRSEKPENYKAVGTGDKEWWKMSFDNTPPRCFRLAPMVGSKPIPYFLDYYSGETVRSIDSGGKLILQPEDKNAPNLTKAFYFIDTSATFGPGDVLPPPSNAASKEDVDAKLKDLEQREAALTQKETDQSTELDKKAKGLQDRQDALEKEEKKRAASKTDFDSKLKALEDREATLTQKDKERSAELDKKEKELKDRQDSSAKEGTDREAASTKKDKDRSAELDKKAKELQEREDALAQQEKDRKAASTKKDSDRSAELDKKAKELQDREDSLARGEKDRETASTKKDKDASAAWDKKMKEVQQRQDALAKEEKDRAASYEKKLKDLQAREDEMAKKAKDQKKSTKDTPSKSDKAQADKKSAAETQRKLDELKATEQKVAADRASLEKSQAVFVVQQEQFRKRQKAFEDKKSASKDEVSQAKDEKAALEKRMAQLEDQLTQMDNARNSNNNKSGKSQANGTDVPSAGCKFIGQKHYKPPRKLGRKVIGIVYE